MIVVAIVGWAFAVVFLGGAVQLVRWLVELEDLIEHAAELRRWEQDNDVYSQMLTIWLCTYKRRTPKELSRGR